jgi:hypothetical protein
MSMGLAMLHAFSGHWSSTLLSSVNPTITSSPINQAAHGYTEPNDIELYDYIILRQDQDHYRVHL